MIGRIASKHLFRAKDYGDDTDRALVKSDGSYTYFAADIAYHRNKYLRGFTHMIGRSRRRSLRLHQAHPGCDARRSRKVTAEVDVQASASSCGF